MPPFLAEMMGQVRAIWARLDGGQRMTLVAVVAASIVGLVALVWYAGQPDYQAVYSAKDPQSFTEAMRSLDSANVRYKLDGQTITVEAGDVPAAKAALFAAGVTVQNPDTNEDLLTGMSTDAMTKRFLLDRRKVKLVEHSITQIEGVQRASVTFDKPKRRLFREDDRYTQPRANVNLTLRPGTNFGMIARNAASTAAAGLGVPDEFIVVTNTRTHQRWPEGPDGMGGAGSSEFLALERERSYEKTEDAMRVLEAHYPGQAVVWVNVELEPEWKITNRKLQAPEPMVTTESKTSDTTSELAASAQGDPSLPAAVNASTGAGLEASPVHTSNKTQTDKSYEHIIGDERTGYLAPDIRRMTVAVTLDESIPDIASVKDSIASLVKTAVGWDPARDDPAGDQSGFTVHVGPFAPAPEAEALPGPGVTDWIAEHGPAIGQVLAVLLVLFFLRGLLRRSAGVGLPTVKGVETEKVEDPGELSPEERSKRMRREIEAAIADDPGAVSRLLETWLAERA